MKIGHRVLLTCLCLSTGLFLAGTALSYSRQVAAAPSDPGLTCSPAPCVLPPTQASEGGSLVTDSPIVTNPMNEKELLLGSVDGNCPPPSGLGFHLSADGGSTWKRVTCMPDIIEQQVYDPLDEPSVGYDREGTAYISGAYFDTRGLGLGFLAVQKSTDGTHWSKPVVALRRSPFLTPFDGSLRVDTGPNSPRANSLYVSGVMAVEPDGDQIMVSHSTDKGATWKQAAVNRVQQYPEEDRFPRMAVGANGTVYATWMHCRGKSGEGGALCRAAHMTFSKSTDGGKTWSRPQQIATVGMPHYWWLPNTNPGIGVDNYPVIAVDDSDGPYSGNLYVAMYSWTGKYLRVQAIRSTDGGTTWSKPVYLAPKSDSHDQFFPSISVSSTGKVGVSWLDRRNDPNNIDYQAFAAISEDGGQTFGPNWQLTTAFSNPDVNGAYNWMGDYTGNTWAGNDFIAAWMDSSNGVDMQEVVGGVRLK
jgi:hypothetical protein